MNQYLSIRKTSLWLPFISGILLLLTLPSFGLWPLVWVALVPFFIFASQKTLSHKRLCLGTLFFGIPYAIAVTYPLMRVTGWWWVSGIESFGTPLLELQFACIIFVVGFWGALFFLPLAYTVRYFGDREYGAILIAFLWIIVEWLRSSFALFGYSWGVLGYTLLDTQYLKHGAALFGVYGLTFLIVIANETFIHLGSLCAMGKGDWWKRWYPIIDAPKKYRGVWFALLAFVFMFSFGVFREVHVGRTSETCATTRVAVIGSPMSTIESIGAGAYRHYRTKITQAIDAHATLLVLPENALPFFEINEADGMLNKRNVIPLPDQEELYADFLSLTSAYPNVSIALGLHTKNNGDRFNTLAVFEKGKPTAYYHKRKLVPFAEYSPLGLEMSIIMPFAHGERKQYFSIGGLLSTALMCSEVSDATIPLIGAQLIISPSNDSVFGSTAIQVVHERMARMRALETNAFLLRATKGGISSIIDQYGVVRKENTGEEILVADICVK